MEIRRIRPDEGPQLRALRLSALAGAPEAFGSILATEEAWTEDRWRDRAVHGAESGERALFIAIKSGVWCGMVGGLVPADEPSVSELVGMWVEPAVRERGVGRALIDAVGVWARKQGARRIQLWVTETNTLAVGMYEHLGFRATGKTQPHPSNSSLAEMHMIRVL